MSAAQRIPILYFSDVLCVWAFFAELRLAEVERNFGDQVELDFRFCSVFGDTPRKIETAWSTKGGYDGFADHVQHAARQFPEIRLHPDLWRKVRPASSLSPHLFLKAVQLTEREGAVAPKTSETALRNMREAFFVHGLDIARREVQDEVGRQANVDVERAAWHIAEGRAHALLDSDAKDAESLGVKGSPTMILNHGRQKLYGNVGYRIIEANILELLREPNADQASWC
ncbi:putative DsbA family dithiol-disulfide isomerase [Rhodoblastus acidophilus]|uniref:DsbA family oxidoreductase n=1 Tax=Rhodoblastus acidophilus TaxID=1074 RepID=UPI0022259E78|nr:DsbA family protein [Rhodoblastus acidophilus]MCW2283996.1 putative DsbA family dithiol-disulfide isomerase [Rhodoblastus acidophilus]MCW2332692.1 putative DsbA family dithiol-disulfide isomerase [Rhodoblastus acidophilus]